MNVFYLDTDPRLAAQYHCDRHLSKMQIEYAQLLSAAVHLNGTSFGQSKQLYKLSHRNHPSAIWCRSSIANFQWLLNLCDAVNDEWLDRGHQPHRSYVEISQHLRASDLAVDLTESTTVPFCAGVAYEQCLAFCNIEPAATRCYSSQQAVQLYRVYYVLSKSHFATYKNSTAPSWYTDLHAILP